MVPGKLKDTVPPHNDDAEKATLGALLLDPEAISSVLHYLRPDDFYRTAHSKAFASILNLFNKGEAIDLITVIEDLKITGNLERAGGASYISQLTSVVPTSANVEYYAGIVQNCSIRRQLLRFPAISLLLRMTTHWKAEVIIEDAERRIFEITDNQKIGSYRVSNEIIGDTVNAIEKLYKTKDSYTGIPTGFSALDNMTSGFQKSEYIIIGARPSVGKTALALTMASNIAIKKKIPVGFFTLEMSSMALMLRLVSSEARIDSKLLRNGMLKQSDFLSLTEAASRIYEAPLYIDDTPNMKLLDLRAQARRMKLKENVQIVFIDYIGRIEPETRGNTPRHEQVAEISRSLKSLARELDIPVVCLSQVGRQSEGKAPNLADLRESGSIEQDADVVIFLHRDRGTDNPGNEQKDTVSTEVIIAKQRNGPVGALKLAFLEKYTKFESLSEEAF